MSDSRNNSIIYNEEKVSDLQKDENKINNLSFESLEDNHKNRADNRGEINSTESKSRKEKVTGESPLKIKIQNSLKSIILKNLSEERSPSGLLRKDSIKTKNCSENKKIAKTLYRPFSQNTNSITSQIDCEFDNKENKDYKTKSPIRRRINFNSLNNFFPKSTKNFLYNNLNLDCEEENELSLENYHRKNRNEIKTIKNKIPKNLNEKLDTDSFKAEKPKESSLSDYFTYEDVLPKKNIEIEANTDKDENVDFDEMKKSVINKPRPSSETLNNCLLLKKKLFKNTSTTANISNIQFIDNSYNLETTKTQKKEVNKAPIKNSGIVTKVNNLSELISINNIVNNNNHHNHVNDHSPIHLLNFKNYSNNRNSNKFNKRINSLSENLNERNLTDFPIVYTGPLFNSTKEYIIPNKESFINRIIKNSLDEKIETNTIDVNDIEQITINDSLQMTADNDKILNATPQENSTNNPILIVEPEINNSSSTLENAQIRVPKLLNTITNLYDMNSERVKKRSQQMKKLKEKFEANENCKNENFNIHEIQDNLNEDKYSIPPQQTGLTRKNKSSNSHKKEDKYTMYEADFCLNNIKNNRENEDKYEITMNNSKFPSTKKYQEEIDGFPLNSNPESSDERTTLHTLRTKTSGLNSDKDKDRALFSGTSNTDADATDNNTNKDKAAEIVISDLECDLEDFGDDIEFKSEIPNLENPSNKDNQDINQISSNINSKYNSNLMQNLGTNLLIANSISSSNKSFVPINNNLKEKNTFSNNKEKATPSYLMALYQYEETDSTDYIIKTSSSMDNLKSEEESSLYNNFQSKNSRKYKNRNNYRVENVIEEETSENYTDMDLSGKKKSSFFYSKLSLSERPDNKSKELLIENINNSNNSNYFSPYNKMRNSSVNHNSLSNNSQNSQINNNINFINISVNGNPINNMSISQINKMILSNSVIDKGQSKSDNFNEDIPETNSENGENKKLLKLCHKASKSELTIHFDMINTINNIQNKHLNDKDEKIEKIKLRKNYLLNTFSKSNSHHEFEKIYNLSKESNEIFNNVSSNNERIKNFKVFNTNSPKAGTSFNNKKLTPSSISRAKFYDEFFEDLEDTNKNKQREQDALDPKPKKPSGKYSARNLSSYLYNSNGNKKSSNRYGKFLVKSNKNYFKNGLRGPNICPRYTLSQEKYKGDLICKTENNENVDKKPSNNNNNKIKKRRNNNSHHNLNPKLNIQIFNALENDENYFGDSNDNFNIENINWENEKEELIVNENLKIKNVNLLGQDQGYPNYKLIKNKKVNKKRENNNILNQYHKESNILKDNTECENMNLVSLISSDSDENVCKKFDQNRNDDKIQRKSSFIDQIEVEENFNKEDNLGKRNESEMNFEDKINLNKFNNNCLEYIDNNGSNQNFYEESLESEANIICEEKKGELVNGENQELGTYTYLEREMEIPVQEDLLDQKNNSIIEKETCLLENQNYIVEDIFASDGNNSKEINTSVIIHPEENYDNHENEAIIKMKIRNDIEYETCNLDDKLSRDVYSYDKNNNNCFVSDNLIINYQFSDKKDNTSRIDGKNIRIMSEKINFNIDNFSPNKESNNMNFFVESPEKYKYSDRMGKQLKNKSNSFTKEGRLSGSDKENQSKTFTNNCNQYNNANKCKNIFESQDLKISDNYDDMYKNHVIAFESTPVKKKRSCGESLYSKDSKNFIDNENYLQKSDIDYSRNLKFDNYVNDNTAITNSEKSKNTCLNFNEIFKNFDEPKMNLMASKVSNLNLQRSTNSINSFINLNKINKGNKTTNPENEKLFISQKGLKNDRMKSTERNVILEEKSFINKAVDENDLKKPSRKHNSMDFWFIESKKMTNLNKNINFFENKKIDESEIQLDQIIIKNVDDKHQDNPREELSIIDFPNISSPFIIEKQRTFSAFKPDNSKAIPKDDIKRTENIHQIINSKDHFNSINKENEINRADFNKNLANKGVRKPIEFKNKKKFNAFNSDAMIFKNNNMNNPNLQLSLRFLTEKEPNFNGNLKSNVLETMTINSIGNHNTLNYLEKNARSNTLSPEIKNVDIFESDKKKRNDNKDLNYNRYAIENSKINNKKNRINTENKVVDIKNIEPTRNVKKQNLVTFYNNCNNKKIEDDLLSLKDENNKLNNEQQKINHLEISNSVSIEISGSDKHSTSINNNNVINNNINNISISIVPGLTNHNCGNLNTIDIASIANYANIQNFNTLNPNITNNYHTINANYNVNNNINQNNIKKPTHKSSNSISEDIRKKNIHQKVVNNIKSLCEQQFRSNSSCKLKKKKENKKSNKKIQNLHHKNPSQLKNSNFINSNNNFYNSMSNQNIIQNLNNIVNNNSDGVLKENLILNNNVNNKTNNANKFTANDNLITFQQKRKLKNYISNNCQNKNDNKIPKTFSSFSPTSNSNLNFYNSNTQFNNNTVFNVNSNNFQTTNVPNYNQITNQGKNYKSDLKQFLVFSERGNNPNRIEKNDEINHTALNNLKNKNLENQKFSFNFNFSDRVDPINYRVNSESSLANYFSTLDSNKLHIVEIMKHLKYQFSSLDHQKMALEKLMKSKSKNFCLLISDECSKKKIHEFKGLYECNHEKNILTKIYSCNYNPNVCTLRDIKNFYSFDFELNEFKLLQEVKCLFPEIHAFFIPSNIKYKKFSK